MVCVRVKDGEDFNAGILKEVRRRAHSLKPSDRRKAKRMAAEKRRARTAKRRRARPRFHR